MENRWIVLATALRSVAVAFEAAANALGSPLPTTASPATSSPPWQHPSDDVSHVPLLQVGTDTEGDSLGRISIAQSSSSSHSAHRPPSSGPAPPVNTSEAPVPSSPASSTNPNATPSPPPAPRPIVVFTNNSRNNRKGAYHRSEHCGHLQCRSSKLMQSDESTALQLGLKPCRTCFP